MIASSFNDFVEKVSDAARNALNTEFGQQITKSLLEEKLKENPGLTADEWNNTKSEFMTWIFCQFVMNHPEAMEELASHTYEEINK